MDLDDGKKILLAMALNRADWKSLIDIYNQLSQLNQEWWRLLEEEFRIVQKNSGFFQKTLSNRIFIE